MPEKKTAPSQAPEPEELLDAREVARRLKLKPETVRGWARAGRIPCRRLNHQVVRFVWAEVLAALGRG